MKNQDRSFYVISQGAEIYGIYTNAKMLHQALMSIDSVKNGEYEDILSYRELCNKMKATRENGEYFYHWMTEKNENVGSIDINERFLNNAIIF